MVASLSSKAFYELNTGRVTSAQRFVQSMSSVEFSFNWFYSDDRDVAFFSSGRLPRQLRAPIPRCRPRASATPTGRGSCRSRPRARDQPAFGLILNWNNKPTADVGSADSNFAYGSVHRVELLRNALGTQRKLTLAGVTGTMNAAATQDLRATDVWPAIRALLRTGNAPSARAEAAAGLVDSWRGMGASRIDGDLDGKVDHPGAAVMDEAWPRIADAVMTPVLGPLVDRLARLMTRSNDPSPGGSAYLSGWYGYLDKDLRALDQPVRGPYSRRYCGAGVLATCREALWRALDTAAGELEKAQALRHRPGARTRPASAFASPPASCRTRCAGRTARPSSRSFRSRVTDRADPWGLASGRPASRGHTARLTAMTRKRYLMAPGPTPVPPEVLAAGAEPIIHHRGPDFRELMLRMLGRLQEVCRTRNDVLVFTASGSGAFESAVVNLLSPGERVLAVSAGEFGERWAATAAAYGADVQDLRYSWGETPRPEDVRARLEETGAEVVFSSTRDVDRRRRGCPGARPGRA